MTSGAKQILSWTHRSHSIPYPEVTRKLGRYPFYKKNTRYWCKHPGKHVNIITIRPSDSSSAKCMPLLFLRKFHANPTSNRYLPT